jgi:PAS domain S-box-containing protein
MTKKKSNPDEAADPSTDSKGSPQAGSPLRQPVQRNFNDGGSSGRQAAQDLRRRAEEIARKKSARMPENLDVLSPKAARQLLHDLRVHQIELEMQNEELRRAQEALESSQARYFDLYDLAPVGYFTLSEKGLILEANLTAAGLLGVTRGALVKKPFTSFIVREDQDVYYRRRKQLFETGAPQVCELRLVKKDGDPFWARVEATAVKDADGAPMCRAAVSDITERKRVEETLRGNEERYRTLIENVGEGIGFVNSEEQVAFANAAAEDVFGLPPSGLLGRSLHEFVSPEQFGMIREQTYRRRAGEKSVYEIEISRPNGEKRNLLITAVPQFDSQGKFMGTFDVFRDITERKRAEEALQESEERYRTVARLSSEFAYSCIHAGDDGYEVDWITNAFFTLTGYSDAELHEQRLWLFVSHPDDREMATKPLRELRAGEADTREFRIVTKGGRVLHIISHMECQVDPKAHGGLRLIGAVQDITERKRAEEAVRRKAKELQEKNDELASFTYAVSHDLKSPLVTIRTFQGHLEQDLRSQDAARIEMDLGYIRNAADKMSRLLDELLRLSRVGRIMNPSEEAPLQAIVKEALDLVAGRITGRGVRVDLTEEPVVLTGDRTRLVEVFQNLVDNAAKFMGDEPAPRVEIGVEQAGDELVLFVRDNGIGIDPRLQPMLFGLFHKLDPGSEGTGIGLALVRRIVEVHGGRIWVESEGPGKGTTFRFTLAKTRRHRAEEGPLNLQGVQDEKKEENRTR